MKTNGRFVAWCLLPLVFLSVPARAEIPDVDKPTVRIGYVIPTNRTEQADGAAILQTMFLLYRAWCREQMELNGFPDTTFNVETETDGWTPKVYVIHTSQTDAYLASNMWSRVGAAATAAGAQLWAANNVWFLVGEAHIMQSDGSLFGHYAAATGDAQSGVAVVSGDCLAMCAPQYLTNGTAYNGLTISEIGPYPMVEGTTFGSGEGSTLSSLCSTYLGANMHEFGHTFHIHHDFRNDWNFFGNLMGNGLRGMRGYIYPTLYLSNFVRSSHAFAIQRSLSRFHRPERAVADATVPDLSAVPSGTVSVEGGLAVLNFSVSDASGLGLALLVDESGRYGGGVLAEQTLSGVSTNFTIRTPYYLTTGSVTNQIRIQDLFGNETAQSFVYSVSGVANRCPWSNIKITPPAPTVGQTVTFDASGASDPDDSLSSVTVQWDFDSDGTYDTAPMACTSTFTTNFAIADLYLVKVRLTDPHGASFVSSPVGMRVGLVKHYVWPESPQPEAPYNSWLNAAHTIQEAVDAAADGEEVVVAPGTYNTGGAATPGAGAANRVRIGKAVTVRSDAGPEQTFIVGASDGGGFGLAAVRCVYVGTNATLSGFTLTNGWTRASGDSLRDRCGGGALVMGGSVTNCNLLANSANMYGGGAGVYYGGSVLNCTLADNRATRGGAVDIQYSGGASSLVQWCEIHDNVADNYGGGVYCRGAGLVANSLVYSNTAGRYGGGVHVAYTSRVENCAIYANATTDTVTYGMGGGVMCEFDGPELYNCTVADNDAGRQGGGVFIKDGNGAVVNSILYFNTATSGANWQTGAATGSQITYSCTTPSDGLPGGAGCIASDPLFVDRAARDYRLLHVSSACNAGLNSAWASNALDVAGSPRITSDVIDMGAYECYNAGLFADSGAALAASTESMVAWGDYDNDGDLDLVVNSTVYRNDLATGGGFTDIGAGFFSAASGPRAAWGDADNDGDLDVVLTGYSSGGKARLYRNDGGTFTEVDPCLTGVWRGAVAWGDYDNDGDLDLVICGSTGGGSNDKTTDLYRNDGGNVFTKVSDAFSSVGGGSAEWGDYDNDSDLDLLLCGDTGSDHVTKVYRNDGGGTFTDIGAGLVGIDTGEAHWGDYDNDGDLDIVLSGRNTSHYAQAALYNNSGGTFTEVNTGITSLRGGSLAWGDTDNDGDLDLLTHGYEYNPSGSDFVRTYLYTNNGGVFERVTTALPDFTSGMARWGDADGDGALDIALAGYSSSVVAGVWLNESGPHINAAPGVPTSPQAVLDGNSVTLTWGAASDDHTPAPALTYNVRLGTIPGGTDLVAPQSDPVSGDRRLPTCGNAGLNLSKTVDGLPYGTTFYWSIQAVDTACRGGAWTTEGICQIFSLAAVDTHTVSNITVATADCGGTVTTDGGAAVTSKGLVWGTAPNPTTDSHPGGGLWDAGGGLGVFSHTISGLTESETYYVRAYAVNSLGTVYGDEQFFTTLRQPPGNGLDFDGSNDYVGVADDDALDLTTAYTLECWFRADALGGLRGLISKYMVASANGYFLRLSETELDFDGRVTGGLGLRAGCWYHAAAVNSGGTRTLYVNGRNVSLGSGTMTVAANADPLRLGSDFSSRYLDGRMDEVRIWSVARTETEILANMHRELRGDEAGLIAYFTFSAQSGSVLSDRTGNGHVGTLVNMADDDWVASSVPCAFVLADAADVRGVWSAQSDSFASARVTLEDAVVTGGEDFTLFGHDDAAETQNVTDVPAGVEWRLGRVWRVEQQGGVTAAVTLDTSGFTGNFALLIDDDGTFVNGTLVGGSRGDGLLRVNDLALSDGMFLTLSRTTASYDCPYVETLAASNVTYHSAECGGMVTNEGASAVTERGVVWNTTGRPTMDAHQGIATVADGGTGVFTCDVVGLAPTNTYYVRAYAVNNQGTSYGDAVSFTTPVKAPGGCVDLNGSDQKICTIGGALTPAIRDELTVEAWVRLDDVSKDQKVVCRFAGVSSNRGYNLGVSGGMVYPEIWDSTQTRLTVQGGEIHAGHWTHLAMTYKRGESLIGYINGIEACRTNAPDMAINPADEKLNIGVSPDSFAQFMNGSVDEVRLWCVAHTPEQIQATMHRELTGTETGLSGCYRLDEMSGTRAENLTSSVSYATLYNTPTWRGATWPCAIDIADQQDLCAVWSERTNSLASSIVTMENAAAAEPNSVVIGHDDGAMNVNFSDKPVTINWRLQRVWKTEDNGIPAGTLRFDCNEISGLISTPERLRLLRDEDGVFADAALVSGVYSNGVFTAENQPLATESYYTLAELQTGPYTYYVDASRPDDSGNGTSWATAKRTIQAAVDLTAWGDAVLVTNGVYGEGGVVLHGQNFTNRVAITKGITVAGVDGPAHTFIVGVSDHETNGPAAARCVWISDGLLTGFTITNGHTQTMGDWGYYQRGGGVILYGGGTVSNCVICGNSANITGGGADFHYGNARVVDCLVEGNSAGLGGGGIGLHRGALLDGCIVRNNAAVGAGGDGGGLYFYSGGTVRNCLIADNSADDAGGGVYVRSAATNALLESCTVVTNTAARGGGVYVTDGTNLNCVIYDNTATVGSNNWQIASGTAVFDHCDTTPLPAGAGNISTPPLFVDAAGGDCRLRDGSPCVNAGLNREWMTGASDLDGAARVRVGIVDMGAYEYAWRACGNALDFNGTNACVSLGTEESLALTNGAFTIEAWIKPVMKASISSVFGHKNSGSANPGYAFYINTWNTIDGRLKFETQSNAAGTVDPVITWNVWQHVAVMWDGAALRFYVNGEEKAGTGNFNLTASTVPAMLGGFSDTNSFYKGAMDEMRVWSVARGADVLRDAMHKTLVGDEAGLLAYYRCDATAGTALPDMSGNGRVGTLVNGTAWTDSRYPVADAIAGLANLCGDWIARTNSLASSLLSVSNAVISGTDFRVFGHDGGTLERNTVDKPTYLVWRLNRVWQAEGEGAVAGDVSFDCSDIASLIGDGANLRLVCDSGGPLADASTVPGVCAGNVFTVFGVSIASGASYTLGEQGVPVTITSAAGTHGTVTPTGAVSVPYGGSTNFVVTPDTYYHVADVTTNGASVGAVTAFAWSNAVADGTIHADFAADLTSRETPYPWLARFGLTDDFEAADLSDTDNDGHRAWQEYVADTDPTNAASLFVITAISNATASARSVSFLSSVSRTYTLLGSADLAAGVWTPVTGAGPRLGAGGADALTDTNAPPQGPFYKVRVELP